MTRREVAAGILLGSAGFAINWFKLPLFFDVDFLFGSVFSMFALLRFGPATGLLAALIAASCTWFHWHHPWAIIIFGCEALCAGWLMGRRRMDLLLGDIIYWFTGGLLLVWLFYHQVMGFDVGTTLMIALKQGVNGISNTLLAKALFLLCWRGRAELPSLRNRLLIVLQGLVLVPAFMLAYADINWQFTQQMALLQQNTVRMAEVGELTLSNWVTEERAALKMLTTLVGDPSRTPPQTQQLFLEKFRAAHPKTCRVGVMDHGHVTRAFSPLLDEKGAATVGVWLGDRPYISGLDNPLHPAVYAAFQGKLGTPGPRLILLLPSMVDTEYRGAVFSVISLDHPAALLRGIIGRQAVNLTLLDQQRRVVASTRPDMKFLAPFTLPEQGQLLPQAGGVRQWLADPQPGVSAMKRWSRSFYLTEVELAPETGFRLVVESSLVPALTTLNHRTLILLGVLAALILVVIALSRYFSRRLLMPITALGRVTGQLPTKIALGEQITWPPAQVQEELDLQGNFRLMEQALRKSFQELNEINEGLELRVIERTEELRCSRDEWARTFDAVPDLIAILDTDYRIIKVNQAMAQALGMPPGDAVNQPCYRLLHNSATPCNTCPYPDFLKDRKEQRALVYEEHLGGWFQVTVSPLTDGQGKVIGAVHVARDITERVQLEEEHRSSKASLALAMDMAVLVKWELDLVTRTFTFDDQFYALYATTAAREGGFLMPLEVYAREFVHPDEVRVVADAVKKVVVAGSEVIGNLEHRIIRRDGAIRHISVRYAVIRNEAGQPTKLFGVNQDLTERKRSEDELRKSAAWLTALKDRSPVGILVADVHRVIQDTNPAFSELFGYAPEELLGQSSQIIHISAESSQEFGERFYALIRSGRQIRAEYRFRRKNGEIFWADIAGQAIVPGDLAEGTIWMLTDITDRKREETRDQSINRRQQAQLRLAAMGEVTYQEIMDFGLEEVLRLTESAVGYIYLYDEEQRLFTLYSWSREVLPACAIMDKQTSYELDQTGLWGEVVRQRSPIVVNDFAASHDEKKGYPEGHVPLTRFLSIPVTQQNRIVAVVGVGNKEQPYTDDDVLQLQLFMDGLWNIVERRRTETDLRLAKVAADSANKAKSEFLANMSHEIRTPMNAIIGLGYLLQQTELAAEQRDYLVKLDQSARSLLLIINDILDISRIEAGKLVLEEVDFSLRDSLEHVVNIIETQAGAKGLTLHLALSPALPELLHGDSLRLEQVLINLLGNAVKFTEQGAVTLTVDRLDSSDELPMLVFSVRDTGIGLTPEQLAGLFQPFSQGDTSTTRRYGGSGLGLSIAQRIVTLMQGEITVESVPGSWSTFAFTARFGPAAGTTPSPPAAAIDLRSIRGARALVVEDNQINLIIARQLLAQAGLRVTTATTGRKAVTMIATTPERFDVVLMDIQMPDMDGYEATRLIRQQWSGDELPVIAMTAYALADEVQKCRDVGMNDHLAKPVDVKALQAKLRTWIRPRPGLPEPPDLAPAGSSTVAAVPEEVPKLSGLQPEEAMVRLNLSWSGYRELIIRFERDHREAAALIQGALEAGDQDAARITAHTLKGVAGNIAARSLAEIAGAIESALKGGHPEEARRHLCALEAALAEVMESADLLSRTESVVPEIPREALDAATLNLRLQELSRLLAGRDLGALEIFAELRPFLEMADPTRLATLAETMERLDFAAALDLLRTLAESSNRTPNVPLPDSGVRP